MIVKVPTIIYEVDITNEDICKLNEAINFINDITSYMKNHNCSMASCQDYDDDIIYDVDALEETSRILENLESLYRLE